MADALATAEAGADLIGVAVDNDGIVVEDRTVQQAREIFAAVESRAITVALSLSADPRRIVRMVEAVQPGILHLAAGGLSLEMLAHIKHGAPGTKLMVAIPVDGPGALRVARQRAELADYLILDSVSAKTAFAGATGRTHDWSISRRIVQESTVPVVLAGGLSADNVAEAIETVRPWGVDSFTRTDVPGERGRKDLARVRAFIDNARQAAVRLDQLTGSPAPS